MFKKLLFLLLPVTISYADSTSVKPLANLKPVSYTVLLSGHKVPITDKGPKLLGETNRPCPSHLRPIVTTSLIGVDPLVGCSSTNICFIGDLHLNVYVEDLVTTYKVMSNDSYAQLTNKDGTISGTTGLFVDFVLTCVA